MIIKLFHCLIGGDVDRSDYVVDIDEIPIKSRNKDWSMVLPGMDFTTNKVSFTEGDRIRIEIDGVTVYAGYITEIVKNYGKDTYNVSLEHEVKHLISGKLMAYRNLSPVLFGFTGGALGTVTSGGDTVTSSAHGLETGDWVYVKNQSGFIPDPSVDSKYSWHYKVYKVDSSNFKLYVCNYSTGIVATTFVTFAATGAFTFKKTTGFNVKTTSGGLEYRLFTLSTFLGQIFIGLGLTLSVTDISAYKFNAAGNTITSLSVILNMIELAGFDGTAIGNINQFSTLEDVVSEICSALGLQFRCTGDKTYKIHACGRDSIGDISYLSYTPDNDGAVKYKEKRDKKDSEGYKTLLRFSDDIEDYLNIGPDLTDYDTVEVLANAEARPTDVSIIPNLVFFLGSAQDFSSTSDRLSAVESTYLRIIDEYNDIIPEEYEFAYIDDDADIFEAKELSFDCGSLRYKLDQEATI